MLTHDGRVLKNDHIDVLIVMSSQLKNTFFNSGRLFCSWSIVLFRNPGVNNEKLIRGRTTEHHGAGINETTLPDDTSRSRENRPKAFLLTKDEDDSV
jgi:hypothetical protein